MISLPVAPGVHHLDPARVPFDGAAQLWRARSQAEHVQCAPANGTDVMTSVRQSAGAPCAPAKLCSGTSGARPCLWALAGINENVANQIRWQRHQCGYLSTVKLARRLLVCYDMLAPCCAKLSQEAKEGRGK